MATTSSAAANATRRLSSNSLAALLARDSDDDEEQQEITVHDGPPVIAAAPGGELELDRPLSRGLAKTRRLIRTVSHSMSRRMTKKNDITTAAGEETINGPDIISSGCLRLYSRGTGCKVGACEEFDFLGGGRGVSTAADECLPHHRQAIMPRIEAMLLHRFSHGVSDVFRRRRSFKKDEKRIPDSTPPLRPSTSDQHQLQFTLPDDVLEMCLVRLPLSSLMTARLVCRRWRALSTTPHFMQIRERGSSYYTPWLFLFGITAVNNGSQQLGSGQIHALDVSSDRWHTITADFLTHGRYMFSVATIGTHLYVVGGCSRYTRNSSHNKTHKSVFVFNPLTASCSKAASMRCPRSAAVLGVVHVTGPNFNSAVTCRRQNSYHRAVVDRCGRAHNRTRLGGLSDVYQDPHRCSVRRHQLRDAFSESDDDHHDSPDSRTTTMPNSFSSVNLEEKSYADKRRQYAVLIAVGGIGSWDEPLDSAEMYDPSTNRWLPIAKLPAGFGLACSGTVCNGVFYVYSEADKLVAYSLVSGTWTTIHVSPPAPPRLQGYFPKLVSCKDRHDLFLIAVSWCDSSSSRATAQQAQRGSSDKAIRKMWKLNSSSSALSWTEVSRHPDAPMDFNANFVGHNSSIYGVEMFRVFGQLLSFITVCDVSESGYKWSRISRNNPSALEADWVSCRAKAMAVLHL